MTEWSVPATVIRVIDADTTIVEADLGWRVSITSAVRIARVDAPERYTSDGEAAKTFVEGLLPPDTAVTLVSHKLLGQFDKYGRVLGSITLPDGRDLATVLLETGNAVPYEEG